MGINMDEMKPLSRYQLYRLKNRDAVNERARKRAQADPELHNERSKQSRLKHHDTYVERDRARSIQYRAKWKALAIAALGGVCVGCGCNADIRALQIDHIASDGWSDRIERNGNQQKMYRQIAEHGSQGKYQILCANCNQIKRMEEQEHPGRRKRIP
jgi:hypothetical protein